MFLKIGYTGSKQYEAKYLHFEKNSMMSIECWKHMKKIELNKTFILCSMEGNTQKKRGLMRYLQFDNTVLTF